jgi:hypothetical protein
MVWSVLFSFHSIINNVACNIVDFRNVSDNHFNNMITTDYVQNFTTIDLSNNDFENFTISLDSLPQLTAL